MIILQRKKSKKFNSFVFLTTHIRLVLWGFKYQQIFSKPSGPLSVGLCVLRGIWETMIYDDLPSRAKTNGGFVSNIKVDLDRVFG